MKTFWISGFAAALALVPAQAQEAPDWGRLLQQDVRAFHDSVAANHPGPHNTLDPGFSARSDLAFSTALDRSGRVTDFAGYVWALRAYTASFDDGHVQLGFAANTPDLATAWPGFLTGFDGSNRQVVRVVSAASPVPLGAELVSCDGVQAYPLSARNVGGFRGRWQLLSQRMIYGGRLFVDAGNPFFSRPQTCVFRVDGSFREETLDWRPLSAEELSRGLAETAPRAAPPIEFRLLADGTYWLSMSSFGRSDPQTVAALTALLEELSRSRDAVTSARRVVLDLRGNGGGSSDWALQLARLVWGEAAVAARSTTGAEAVEWRASPANLAVLKGYANEWHSSPDASDEMRSWANRVTAGLEAASAAGQPLWRDASGEEEPAETHEPAPGGPAGKVFVLTDWSCASACLDAVDLWHGLGAILVGQETAADTLYMDLREEALPSGMASVAIPMKVYRGRSRGSNVPWTPTHAFDGDMRDTPAVERWLLALPD